MSEIGGRCSLSDSMPIIAWWTESGKVVDCKVVSGEHAVCQHMYLQTLAVRELAAAV